MLRRGLLLTVVPALLQAQSFDTIQVRAQQLRGGIYVLTGQGGNIGLSVGDDAAFLVDDQFAPLTPKVLAAIGAITTKPVKFVVNTHWHFDHTGGNENMGKAGALLVAHGNARRRMTTQQFIEHLKRTEPPAPPGALPVVTFTDSASFHLNGEEIVAFHVGPAHTDGDVAVHFTRSNVVHMGDTYVANRYPFVDLSSGGNANGVVAMADRVLTVCNTETRVIPGHGAAVTDCAALKRYRDMIVTVRDRVQAAMRSGRTLDAIKAAKPTAEFDATHRGSISPDDFVAFVYRSLGGK
jgi:cyclase